MKRGEFPGFVGQAYEAPDPFQDRQVCVNYYVEISGDKDSKTPTALLSAPGKLQVARIWDVVPLTITTTALLDGTQGMPYKFTLTADDGSPAYVWLLLADTNNTTLTLSLDGVLSGTPAASGLCSFKIQVTDSLSNVAIKTLTGTFASVAATVPVAPTIGTAVAGNSQATVNWTLNSNGGATITSVTVFCSNGQNRSTAITTGPFIWTGLTNGTPYTFYVEAVNSVGPSVPSGTSNSITPFIPATVPGQPAPPVATAGNGFIGWVGTAPTSNGGSAITGYVIESSPATTVQSYPGLSGSFVGVLNGTNYTLNIAAVNAIGQGPWSNASNAVTPTAGGAPFYLLTRSLYPSAVGMPYFATLIAVGGGAVTFTDGATSTNYKVSSAGVITGSRATTGTDTISGTYSNGTTTNTFSFSLTTS